MIKMKSIYKKADHLALAVLVLLIITSTGWAGQQAVQAPSPFENFSVEQLMAYQEYYYVSGERDPMTMRLPTESEKKPKTTVATAKDRYPTIEEMERFLKASLLGIEESLNKNDYAKALEVSQMAIKKVDEEWPPLKAEPPQLRRMDEQIRNYRSLADRLKREADIAKEFEQIDLAVNGIMWAPLSAKAIVNNKLVEAGEILSSIRKENDLSVESIEEKSVLFQFKGQRYRRGVELYTEKVAPKKNTAKK